MWLLALLVASGCVPPGHAAGVPYDAAAKATLADAVWQTALLPTEPALSGDRRNRAGSDGETWAIDAAVSDQYFDLPTCDAGVVVAVTHDVSECARRGMRTSGRHPPM